MSYDTALKKAWDELGKFTREDSYTLSLLGVTYRISTKEKRVVAAISDTPTKDYLTILLLHYIIGSLKYGYTPSGQWVSFKEIEGGEIYYSAFREGALRRILDKYGKEPDTLLGVLRRFDGKKIKEGDNAIELTTFPDIQVRIIMWKGDDEFTPEATILFDKAITDIYSMEDISVFARFIAYAI